MAPILFNSLFLAIIWRQSWRHSQWICLDAYCLSPRKSMGAPWRACSQHDRWQTSNLCPWCHQKSWTHHYAPLFLREPPLFQVSTNIWKNINRIQEVIINLHEKINYVCKVSKLGHDLLFCPTKIEGFILDLGEYIFFLHWQ